MGLDLHGQVTLGRKRSWRTALRSHRRRRPNYLFTINWADSGPGFSWPEKYYVARIPCYEVCIVIGSADCPDRMATPTSRLAGTWAECRTSRKPASASAPGGRRSGVGDRSGGPACSAPAPWTKRRPNAHIDPSEVYRLAAQDLAFGELLPEKPRWMEQDEYERENSVGPGLERLAREVRHLDLSRAAVAAHGGDGGQTSV